MATAARHAARLLHAAWVFSRYEGLITPDMLRAAPWPLRAFVRLARIGARRAQPDADGLSPVSRALIDLGPSWIKMGQFLATRPDVVGFERARQLAELQDRLPPFAQAQAEARIARELGRPVAELFTDLGQPVAAASIAQVHKGVTSDGRAVAVKVLRPGIRQRFAADLESFRFAARLLERRDAEARRLRLVEVVETMARSVEMEMDLRMEAAAMAEMRENAARHEGRPVFHVPAVDWQRTTEGVLSSEWIDATPLNDIAALKRAGHDLEKLADHLMQAFLVQTLEDGFFHADLHPGNLFVDDAGRLIAVDYGITGRLSEFERRVWAEILHCFITGDHRRNAQVHFEAGYVPPDQSPEEFAQALRAIGEPIMGRTAEEISMAALIGQLFATTGKFAMRTQPQLLLMHKTMVVVEGVARALNPRLDMWRACEPVVKDWITRHLGPAGRLRQAADGAREMGRAIGGLPQLLQQAADATRALADMSRAQEQAAKRGAGFWQNAPLWIAAAALVAMAVGWLLG